MRGFNERFRKNGFKALTEIGFARQTMMSEKFVQVVFHGSCHQTYSPGRHDSHTPRSNLPRHVSERQALGGAQGLSRAWKNGRANSSAGSLGRSGFARRTLARARRFLPLRKIR